MAVAAASASGVTNPEPRVAINSAALDFINFMLPERAPRRESTIPIVLLKLVIDVSKEFIAIAAASADRAKAIFAAKVTAAAFLAFSSASSLSFIDFS